jgi:hypothetical protein
LTFGDDGTQVKAFIGHSNQSQGFAFGYRTIKKTGGEGFSLAMDDPNGQYYRQWAGLLGGFAYDNEAVPGPALAQTQGWQHRWWANGNQEAVDLLRRRTDITGGALAMERFWQLRNPAGGFANHSRQTWSNTQANSPAFSVNPSNQLGDRLLTLFGDPAVTGPGGVFSIGIKSGTLAYLINGPSSFHRWYRENDDKMLFSVSGAGNVTVDPAGDAPAGWAGPVIRFGGEASNDGFASQRTGAGDFLNALAFYTGAVRRMAVKANGRINITLAGVPVFASNALALAGGLVAGDIFRDALGGLHIVT